jgi:hypothetical protein
MSFVGLAGRREVRRSFADLVELNVSIDVHALARESAFVEGVMTELRLPAVGGGTISTVPAHLEASKFWIGDQPIPLRWHLHLPQRSWGCPRCDRDCRFLFDDRGRWVCRTCARKFYASRVASPLPGLHKIYSLRRYVSANPQPFTPLPVRRRKKQWRALCEIRRLEQALLAAVRADAIPGLQSLLDDGPRRPRPDSNDVGRGLLDRQGRAHA